MKSSAVQRLSTLQKTEIWTGSWISESIWMVAHDFSRLSNTSKLPLSAAITASRANDAASDLAAWPAINEAFGMALLEAQAAGLPVVAADRPGIAQMVRNGQTGMLAPQGDVDAFAAALSALLADPGRRAEMRDAALAATAREHDISSAARQLNGILESTLQMRREAVS